MTEHQKLVEQNKTSFMKTECELSLEYSWNKSDVAIMERDKEAIQGFLWHCEGLEVETVKNTISGMINFYLEACIHPKISLLDEIVRLLELYCLRGNRLTISLGLPAEIKRMILDKYSFWTIHIARTQQKNQ